MKIQPIFIGCIFYLTIIKITGSFEGYVPTATDLYLRGNNPAGFTVTSGSVLQSGGIQVTKSNLYATGNKTYNFSGYNRIQINFRLDAVGRYSGNGMRMKVTLYNKSIDIIGQSYTNVSAGNTYTINVNVNPSTFAPKIDVEYQVYTGGGDSDWSWWVSNWSGWIWQVKMS